MGDDKQCQHIMEKWACPELRDTPAFQTCSLCGKTMWFDDSNVATTPPLYAIVLPHGVLEMIHG